MATSKTLNDYFGKSDTSSTTKRIRSTENTSPSGVTPPAKRADHDPSDEGDEFAIPEDAPCWVGTMMKMMKKCTTRVDTIFNKLDSLEKHFTEQFNSLRDDLNSVTESVTFLSNAHDEQLKLNAVYSKDISDLQAQIKSVEENNETLKNKCKGYEDNLDALEQYGRRNCLLLHGVPEMKGEKTDDVFRKAISENLNIDIAPCEIDRSHRLGKPKTDGKARPIIAKFARYNCRASVFAAKKQLKGTSLLITESLTKRRVTVLNKAIETYGSKKVWTIDGEVFTKNGPDDAIKHIKIRPE